MAVQNYLAVIKVVGIGGGVVNVVNRMIEIGVKGVEFIAINTDAQALLMSDADVKLDVGRDSPRGLGAGANPDIGKPAAEDHPEDTEPAPNAPHICLRHPSSDYSHGHSCAPAVTPRPPRLRARPEWGSRARPEMIPPPLIDALLMRGRALVLPQRTQGHRDRSARCRHHRVASAGVAG